MTSIQDSDLNGLALAFINRTATSPNTYGGGLVGATDFTISANAGAGSVSVTTGRAWLPNAIATGISTNMYGIYLDSTLNVSIASNSSGSSRIDYIVLYLNLNIPPSATGNNIPQLGDAQGAPSASPVAPTVTQIVSGNGTWAGTGVNNPYLILAQFTVPTGFTGTSTVGTITPIRQFAYFTTGQTVPVPQFVTFTDQSVAPSNPSAGSTNLFTIGSNLFLRQPGSVKQVQIGSSSLISNGSSGGTPSVDWSQGISQAYTLSANATYSFSNPVPGEKLILFLKQPSTGGPFTVTWPSAASTNGVIWPNGNAPTLSTTNSYTDVIGFIYDNIVNRYRGLAQPGYQL